MSKVSEIFKGCVEAIRAEILIKRESQKDKEFHFQNWFKDRLHDLSVYYDQGGRNSYPDFWLVERTDAYELKGLAYPGREANFDCNSRVPCGEHNGRQVYYVFGRYPACSDGNCYPVLDLVLCHGSFLNADNAYVHENKSFTGFGSFGDILLRDRQMSVAPTPFKLAQGTAHRRPLIVPEDHQVDRDLIEVGNLVRREVERVVVAYSFDLRENNIDPRFIDNPNAGKEHKFKAYRIVGDPQDPITMQ